MVFALDEALVSGTAVIVRAASVERPIAVGLGWRSDSNSNLVNSNGLPALPFSAALETR